MPPAPFQLSAMDSAASAEAESGETLQLEGIGGGEGFASLPPPSGQKATGPLQLKIRKSEGLIGEFGDTYRELDINPDKNVATFSRWDDAPVQEEFRVKFNKLENWHIYVKQKAPHLMDELLDLTDSKGQRFAERTAYVDAAKDGTKAYKKGKRDLSKADISETEDGFEEMIESLIERMKVLDGDVRNWFEGKEESGDLEGEDLDNSISREGNRMFRETWKDAIYDVNRLLKSYWPALKADLQKWVIAKQNEGLRLSGQVGELTYIGSLAKGYKGPPKQHVRFNPDKYDVDASLDAPPIAQFAQEERGLKTDKGKIFGSKLYRDIPALESGSRKIEDALDRANVVPKDDDDPFEIAFPAPDTAGQINQYSASAGLSFLRDHLSADEYDTLASDPIIAGSMVIDDEGAKIGEISDARYGKVRKKLLDVLDQIPEEEMGKEAKAELKDILRQNMVKDFGNEHREEGLNPEEDVESFTRWDDSPIDERFREEFNQLENWDIYVKTKFNALYAELAGIKITDELTFAHRAQFVEEAKAATKSYKSGIRDLANGDIEDIKGAFDKKIDDLIDGMQAANATVREWFEGKDEADGVDGDQLAENVKEEGTELWRDSWKDAMYEVNKILNAHWPGLKKELEAWVYEKREEGLHLSGEIGDLTYIGSLAKGYKGPPKQHIRFNPDKFDVDASLAAPPIAQFATEQKGLKTDKGKIFGKYLYEEIPELERGSKKIENALDSANVVPRDDDDPFEIAFPAKDTARQINQYSASAGLSFLRDYISNEDYETFISDPVITSSLVIDEEGSKVGEISNARYAAVRKKILDRMGQIPEDEMDSETRAQLKEVLRQNMLKDYGGEYRKEDLDPQNDIHSFTRWDDAPIKDGFREEYNKLENWSIYIKTKHAQLADEMLQVQNDSTDSMANRENFVTLAKEATRAYKAGIRNIGATNVDGVKEAFDDTLDDLVERMKNLNEEVRDWFESKDESEDLTGEELEGHVDEEGTEIWREAWKDAVYEVNKILNGLWPAIKVDLETWVFGKRDEGMFLPGDIGELTYIGSLAKGYKGPPKQHVRFNPDKFDVDASLEAPPITKFAKEELNLKPDKGKIFGKDLYGEIPSLEAGSNKIDAALDRAGVVPHDDNDPFEIAFPAPETAGQINQYSMSSALSQIREELDEGDYETLINSPSIVNGLVFGGQTTVGEISDRNYERMRETILAAAQAELSDIAFRRISHILRKS